MIIVVRIGPSASGLRPSASSAPRTAMPIPRPGPIAPTPIAIAAPEHLCGFWIHAAPSSGRRHSAGDAPSSVVETGALPISSIPDSSTCPASPPLVAAGRRPGRRGAVARRRFVPVLLVAVAAAGRQRDVDQRQQGEDQRLDGAEQHLQEEEEDREEQRHDQELDRVRQRDHHRQQHLAGEDVAEEPERERDDAGELLDRLPAGRSTRDRPCA